MVVQFVIAGLFMMLAAFASVYKDRLTPAAGIAGWLTGILIFAGAGWLGFIMLASFFIAGTLSSSVGIKKKQQLGLVNKGDSKRTTGQVFANAGVAGILSVYLSLFNVHHRVALVMMAASFASATADTVSSELGNIFGKRFLNIMTFRKDERGLDGVVSLEGTLFGIAGSLLIACCYAFFQGFNYDILVIVVAGTVGNIADSIMGATMERKKILTNNSVNFLNTVAGALIAFLLH